MKTIAKILSSIACVAFISVSAFANKPHLPKHKAQHTTHSKMVHKHHVLSKGERKMQKLRCESTYITPGYNF